MAERIPVSALLPERLDSMARRVKEKLCDEEQIAGMKLAWDFIAGQLHAALKSALDCDLLEVIAGAWAQATPILEFADSHKHPAGERSVVELGAHDFTRELHPVIEVTIAPCPAIELAFLFVLSAHISGVRLSIVDGHIVGGDLGELWANGQLSYQDVPLHPALESTKIALPGEFIFTAPGIKIPRISSGG